jgi:TatD DNase family protein
MFSESHCHLQATDEVISQAKRDGFTLLINAGIDLQSSLKAVEAAKSYDIVKASIGIHPWYADEYGKDVESKFIDLAKGKEVVAISEIGLDYTGRMTKEWVHEDKYIDKRIQVKTINSQLRLARDLCLPAIVHDRTQGNELLDFLIESGNATTGLAIHGFSKGLDYAKKCVDNGIYLSIGLRTIQAAESKFIEAVKWLAIDNILTETDSATPQGVFAVCDFIGEIKSLTREQVGEVATRNLMNLCRIRQSH